MYDRADHAEPSDDRRMRPKDIELLKLARENGELMATNRRLCDEGRQSEQTIDTLRHKNERLTAFSNGLSEQIEAYKAVDKAIDRVEEKIDSLAENAAAGEYFIIKKDGDSWCAHTSSFVNIQESDEVAFAATPRGALNKLISIKEKK